MYGHEVILGISHFCRLQTQAKHHLISAGAKSTKHCCSFAAIYVYADRPGSFTPSDNSRQVARSTLPIQAGKTCRFAQADTQNISRSIACLALPVWISKLWTRRHQLRATFGDDSKIVLPVKETAQFTLLTDLDYFGSARISDAIAYTCLKGWPVTM